MFKLARKFVGSYFHGAVFSWTWVAKSVTKIFNVNITDLAQFHSQVSHTQKLQPLIYGNTKGIFETTSVLTQQTFKFIVVHVTAAILQLVVKCVPDIL